MRDIREVYLKTKFKSVRYGIEMIYDTRVAQFCGPCVGLYGVSALALLCSRAALSSVGR